MIATLNKLKQHQKNEDGAALVIAMMFLIAILGLMVIIASALMISTYTTKESRDRTAYGVALDYAMNDALREANSYSGSLTSSGTGNGGIYSHIGYRNHKEGVMASDTANENLSSGSLVRWRWWAVPVPGGTTGAEYYIYAAAFRGNDPKQDDNALYVRATFDSQQVVQYGFSSVDEGVVYYRPSISEGYRMQFFSELDAEIHNSTEFFTYDSGLYGNTPSKSNAYKNGQVGSGQMIKVYKESDDRYDVNKTFLSQYKREGLSTRCFIVASNGNKIANSTCPTTNVNSVEYKLAGQTVQSVASADGCTPARAASNGDWLSSANGRSLTANYGSDVLCVENMRFDGNSTTTFSTAYSTGRPLYIYVYGTITIDSGHEIRAPQNSPIYGASTLHFFANSQLDMRTSSSGGTPTIAYGLFVTENNCNIGRRGSNDYSNNANQDVKLRGALWCGGQMNVGEGAELWFDTQANASVSDNNTGPISRVWTQVDMRSVVEGELDNSF